MENAPATPPLRLAVFGSTGGIGKQLVSQALERGHTVTAFVRDPSRLETTHERLRAVQGDVLDPATVAPAVQGQDAVLVALGAGGQGVVRTAGTRHVVEAMEAAGVKRLVCLSSLGVGDSRGNLNFLWKYVLFGIFLRKAYADHETQEATVMASSLEWTIARPGAFADGPVTGQYRHGFPPDDRTTQLKIARADVAHFMLEQLGDERYLRRAVSLSY